MVGTDQHFITERCKEVLVERICPLKLKQLGVFVELVEVHDVFGHAFHCVDRIGREKIIFNFTMLIDFRVLVEDRNAGEAKWYNGQVLLKNLTSKGEGHTLEISIEHWKNNNGPTGNEPFIATTHY